MCGSWRLHHPKRKRLKQQPQPITIIVLLTSQCLIKTEALVLPLYKRSLRKGLTRQGQAQNGLFVTSVFPLLVSSLVLCIMGQDGPQLVTSTGQVV
jgi:hypothetical protein